MDVFRAIAAEAWLWGYIRTGEGVRRITGKYVFLMLEIFDAGDKEEKRPKKLQIGGGPLRHRQEWTIIERAVRNILFVSACVRVGNWPYRRPEWYVWPELRELPPHLLGGREPHGRGGLDLEGGRGGPAVCLLGIDASHVSRVRFGEYTVFSYTVQTIFALNWDLASADSHRTPVCAKCLCCNESLFVFPSYCGKNRHF